MAKRSPPRTPPPQARDTASWSALSTFSIRSEPASMAWKMAALRLMQTSMEGGSMLTSLTAVAAMAKGWPSTWAVTTTTERTRLRRALFSAGARSSSMAVVLPCEPALLPSMVSPILRPGKYMSSYFTN
ncbi:hypothetical protein D3C72_648780 [compost metagenome]